MTQKTKIFIALTLVIQLLFPTGLLVHRHTVLKEALATEDEYIFELSELRLVVPNTAYPSADSCEAFWFSINDVYAYSAAKIAVSVGADGLAVVSELDRKKDTDCWFSYDYYNKNSNFEKGEFTIITTDFRQLRSEIISEYSIFNKNAEEKPAYVTAKIHNGVFLPTAIYFNGEKIIDISAQYIS